MRIAHVLLAFAFTTAALGAAPAWAVKKTDRALSGQERAVKGDAAKKTPKTSNLETLARASTKFQPGEARVTNIKRIARMMDGVVVEPGASFSVNHFIGPRTEDKGFVKAPSILDLEYVETTGGGVSQFATTLYNALYDAGFPITEHKPHSHFISRYPAGVEATLSWPSPDLVFKNDSDAPLVIKTSVSTDRVSVKLLGRTPGRKVERKAPVLLERRDPPTEWVADPKMSTRKEKVKAPGSPRKAVRVTRIVKNPGRPDRRDEEVVIYLASKRVVQAHPCKLPKTHSDYEPDCPKKGKSKPKKSAAKP